VGARVASLVVLGLLLVSAVVVAREEPQPRPLAAKVWVDQTARNCDGNSPCYPRIQIAIDDTGQFDTGGTIVVFGDQTYQENVNVWRSAHILGWSPANTTVDGGGGLFVFQVNAANVTIQNLTVTNAFQGIWTGANSTTIREVVVTGSPIGVIFANAPGGTMDRTEVRNADGGAIIVDLSDNVTVNNSIVQGGGRGVTATNSAGFYLTNSELSGQRGAGVTLGGATDVRIEGNAITDGQNRGIWVNSSRGIRIANNTIQSNALTGVNVSYSVNVTVEGNGFSSNGAAGIYPRGVDNPRPWQGSGGGLWFWQTDPVYVRDNALSGNAPFGMAITGGMSTDYFLRGNSIGSNNGSGLIIAERASRIDVEGVLNDNRGDGILLDNVTEISIHDAWVPWNKGWGIRGQYVVNVTVVRSSVTGNGIPGIGPRGTGPSPAQGSGGGLWFWQTDPSRIQDSEVWDNNGPGVRLTQTDMFLLANNSFLQVIPAHEAIVLEDAQRTTAKGNVVIGATDGILQVGGDTKASRNRLENVSIGVSLRGGASFAGDNNTFEGAGYDFYMDQASRATALNDSLGPLHGVIDDLSNLTVQWFLDVSVLDAAGDPAPRATVRILNLAGAEVFNQTADDQGRARWVVLAQEDITRTNTFTHTPHEAQAFVTGPDLGSETVLMNRSQNVTIRLFRDTRLPAIGNVSAAPNPQEQFQPVNVSATVDDQTAVTVWLNVTFPDNTWLNATMTRGAGSTYYLQRVYDQVGIHTFWIAARDAFGNNATLPGSFRIVPPNLGPNITNVVAAPDPQEAGGSVNVSATVTDPEGVASVTILFTYPSGSSIFRVMSPAPGNVWYYADSYTEIGTYQFVITATDGNATFPRSSQASGTFRVQDTTPPVANAGPDQTVPQGTVVTFDGSGSADNLGILSYTWTLTDAGPQTLTGVRPSYTFSRIGVFLVTLTAMDLVGNTGTDTMTVTVLDVTPPQVTGLAATPSPAEVPGTTNVSFAVVEANTIAVAKLGAYDPGGALIANVTATYDAGTARYFHVWSLAALGTYRFLAYAEDQSGNVGVASTTVLGRDTTSPAIAAVGAQPPIQQVQAPLTLWAQASDAFLASVAVEVRDPSGGIAANVTMTFNAGTARYEASFAPSVLGTHPFTVWAFDTSGNAASFDGSFVSEDTVGPTVGGLAVFPQPQEVGGLVDVSVAASDDFLLTRVWIDLTDPTGTPLGSTNLPFNPADLRWHDVRAYAALGTYTFVVWAEDAAGNRASLAGSVLIVDRSPPVVGPLTKAPTTWEVGGTINVSATVTDNVGLQRVSLLVIDPLGREAGNHTMACAAGGCAFARAYGLAGTYGLRVWAEDTSGNFGTASDTLLIVDGQPPVARAGPDVAIDSGDSVAFDGTASTDDYGIVAYTWTFTYRGNPVTRTGPTASFTFDEPGTYTVTLTVEDAGGKTATDTLVVTVRGAGGASPVLLGGLVLLLLIGLALGVWLAVRRRARKKEAAEKSPPKPDPKSPDAEDDRDREIDEALKELEEL